MTHFEFIPTTQSRDLVLPIAFRISLHIYLKIYRIGLLNPHSLLFLIRLVFASILQLLSLSIFISIFLFIWLFSISTVIFVVS